MAIDISVFGIFLVFGLILSILGLIEKKFWPLGFAGGLMLVILAGVLAGDPNITVAYNAGTAINYAATPLMIFGFGGMGFLFMAVVVGKGLDLL